MGVPRQTIYSHLEAMIREGIVLKRVSFGERPRPTYGLNWGRVNELIDALHSIEEMVGELLEELKRRKGSASEAS